MVRFKPGGDLERRNRDFLRLWTSSTVQQFTGVFSDFAFPVLAILLFNATPFEVGLLISLEIIPLPILSLPVGVWVDRVKRLKIIILCNIARMISLGSIPISYFLGTLSLYQIYLVVLVTGAFEVVARTAYQAYIPSVVSREDLLEANQKTSFTGSASGLVGPGIAGYIYQIVGGALSIVIDSLGFLVSAIILRGNKEEEKISLHADETNRSFFERMGKGLEFTLGNKTLRGVALTGIWSSLGNSMAYGITTYFALNYVHFTPATWGIIGTIRSVGFFAGTLVVNRIVKLLGIGVTLALSITTCLIQVIEPSALYGYAFLIFAVANLVIGFGAVTYTIPQVVVKQAITPNRLQGRMNSIMNTMVWGMMAVGSLIGGVLGQTIGVVNTIYLGGVISGTSAIWIILTPVIKLKKAPEQVTEV